MTVPSLSRCHTGTDFGIYFNQVTPENDGKWGGVEMTQGTYSWSSLDNIYYAVVNSFFGIDG